MDAIHLKLMVLLSCSDNYLNPACVLQVHPTGLTSRRGSGRGLGRLPMSTYKARFVPIGSAPFIREVNSMIVLLERL